MTIHYRAVRVVLLVGMLAACTPSRPAPTPVGSPTLPLTPSPVPIRTLPIPPLDWAAEMARPPRCDPAEQRAAIRSGTTSAIPDDLPLCYDITVAFDGAATAFRAVTRIRVVNDSPDPWTSILLRLYPRSRHIYNGQVTVNAMRLHGQPVEGRDIYADQSGVHVPLAEPLAPGAVAEIAVDTSAVLDQPPVGAESYGLFTRTARAALVSSWYPMVASYRDGRWRGGAVPGVGDAVVADSGWLRATIHAPEDLTLVATGTLTDQSAADGFVAYTLVTGPTRDVALALLDGYESQRIEVDGLTIQSWYPPGRGDGAAVALVAAERALALYSERFAPYPFAAYQIVALPLQGYGGMEFPQVALLDERLYAGRTLENGDDLQALVAHEVSHQWWYGIVGSDPTEEAWLDEGLATWSENLWRQQHGGETGVMRERAAARRALREAALPPDAFRTRSDQMPSADFYNYVVYRQADLFLEALHRRMWEPAFSDALTCYYEQGAFRIATAETLLDCMDRSAPQPLESLYRMWQVNR